MHLLSAASFLLLFYKNTPSYMVIGMSEVHLKENWRKYQSWHQTSWRSMHTSDRGGRDWDRRDTNSLAADAASSTSERVERTESGGGKTSEMKQNYLNVTSDDLWCIRDKLSGKKSSLYTLLWDAGSTPEGTLAQVSFLVRDQLEGDSDLGKGRNSVGRACYQFLGR